MDYELFKENLTKMMRQAIEKESDGKITEGRGPKDNKIMDQMNYVPENSSVGTTMYPEYLYEEYLTGKTIQEIVSDAIQHIKKSMGDAEKVHELALEKFKIENVVPTLISQAGNEEYLKSVPYVSFEDLAITFRIEIAEINASMKIGNHNLEKLGVSVQELKEIALKNASFTESVLLMSMEEALLIETMPDYIPSGDIGLAKNDAFPMVVITNSNRNFGAAAILNTDALKKVAEALDDDLYILPSSIHECIAVPVGDGSMENNFREMIRDVNENEVSPEERLSDQLYFFDSKTLTLNMVPEEPVRHNKISEPEKGRR